MGIVIKIQPSYLNSSMDSTLVALGDVTSEWQISYWKFRLSTLIC